MIQDGRDERAISLYRPFSVFIGGMGLMFAVVLPLPYGM